MQQQEQVGNVFPPVDGSQNPATKGDGYPVIYRGLTIPSAAGCLPSTVLPKTKHGENTRAANNCYNKKKTRWVKCYINDMFHFVGLNSILQILRTTNR